MDLTQLWGDEPVVLPEPVLCLLERQEVPGEGEAGVLLVVPAESNLSRQTIHKGRI